MTFNKEWADKVLNNIFVRAQQWSTWRGVAALAASAGIISFPEAKLEMWYAGFMALLGVLAITANEPTVKKDA